MTFVLDIEHCRISIGVPGKRFLFTGPPGFAPDTIVIRTLTYRIKRGDTSIVTLLTLHHPGIRLLNRP